MKNGMGEGAGDGMVCRWEGGYGGKNHYNPKVVLLKFIFIKEKLSI